MSIKNILVTGARAPATLFLIRKLSRCGYKVFAADCSAYYIGKYSSCIAGNYTITAPNDDWDRFISDIADIARTEHIDLLIPTCEEIFYVAQGKKELTKYCRVFCDEPEVLLKLHNKWTFFCQAEERYSSVKLPKSWYAENLSDLKEIIEKNLSGQKFVIKPIYSRFASKVIISDTLPEKLDQGRYIVQEYIKGKQFCSYSIIKNRRICLHSDYKTVFTAGKGATIAFSYEAHPSILKFVEEFAEKENFYGQAAFDFIENDDGLYLIECNPRLTSGIQLFDESKNFYEIFQDSPSETLFPNKKTKSALQLAMLMYFFSNVGSFKDLRIWLATVFASKDVIFDIRDLKPCIMQLPVMIFMLIESYKRRISLQEISTYDIEYNGKD